MILGVQVVSIYSYIEPTTVAAYVVTSHALPTVPVYKKKELPHYYASLKLL